MTNSERREISNEQIFKTLRSARDSLFKAGNKNSFDMSSGGPKDHFPRFFWESEVFFEHPKSGPLLKVVDSLAIDRKFLNKSSFIFLTDKF